MESPYGRRQPVNGRTGIYLSVWVNVQDLAVLDDLADRWQTTRSATLKRAIAETQTRVKRRLKPVEDR